MIKMIKNAALAFKYLKRRFVRGNKPNFLIIGAQKCGTTSLFSYLNECEGFMGANRKELHYFDLEDNFKKGNEWYENHFLGSIGRRGLFFEASPSYLYCKKTPVRLRDYSPDLKFIIILREPISRAYSAWNMYRHWSDSGVIPRAIAKDQYERDHSPIYLTFFKDGCPTFSEYINIEANLINEVGIEDTEEEPSILRRGIYKPQIERYVELFGWENLLILEFNQLKNNREAVIRKCHEFLGVPYKPRKKTVKKEIKNKRPYNSEISPSDHKILQEFYDHHNRELSEYLGYQPDW